MMELKNLKDFNIEEEIAKAAIVRYTDDRGLPENFSFWYNQIKNFGEFKHTKVIANQIFTKEELDILEDTDDFSKVDFYEITKILIPTLDKMNFNTFYNIKNGCFSDKFNFENCITTRRELPEKLWKINYDSCMFDTGGDSELVVRELLPYTLEEDNLFIYNGMPLRTEIRVFYNVPRKRIEAMYDYWNYNYCIQSIAKNKTDKIIFDYFHHNTNHKEEVKEVAQRIYKAINKLEFSDKIVGVWSIDFVYIKQTNEIYLIDMARAERSAYYNYDEVIKF